MTSRARLRDSQPKERDINISLRVWVKLYFATSTRRSIIVNPSIKDGLPNKVLQRSNSADKNIKTLAPPRKRNITPNITEQCPYCPGWLIWMIDKLILLALMIEICQINFI